MGLDAQMPAGRPKSNTSRIKVTLPPGTAFRDALRVAAGQRDTHLRALIERPANHRPGSSALNLAVYSAKGGSGRTTLALNIAAELGQFLRKSSSTVAMVALARSTSGWPCRA